MAANERHDSHVGVVGLTIQEPWLDFALPAYSGAGPADGVYVNGLLDAGAIYLPLGSGRDIAVALATPAVPEPSTWALIALGFAAFGVFARSCSAGARRLVHVEPPTPLLSSTFPQPTS